MDIEKVYILFKNCYKEVEQTTSLVLISSDSYRINNLKSATNVVYRLESAEYLGQSLESFQKILEEIGGREINIANDKVTEYRAKRDQLLIAMEYVIKTYESTKSHDEEKIGLNIKLPINENFTDFRKNIDDLEFVLTKCPFFHCNEETLQFKSVHNGSILLTFIVAGISVVTGSLLLNNIAAFIDKCIIIKSHKLTQLKQEQEIERSNTDRKEKEEIYKYMKKIYKIQIENALKELEQDLGYEIKDGDEMGRAEQAIERFNKLIDKGIQIYSTIGSPEETKALFEPLEMKFLSLRDQLKYIEKKDWKTNQKKCM